MGADPDSERGRKESNQDFHGAMIPAEPTLSLKGVAVALADGISSSPVSREASESAVKSFLLDYYCTPDSWSVKTSAQRVIDAANSWLHAQTRRGHDAYDPDKGADKGYVCTLSALVIKSRTAHIFHVGDCRIYRVAGSSLEQLTEDHRVVVSSQQTYLGRALGVQSRVELDYLPLQAVRLMLQYTGFTRFNGGGTGYDGVTARSPRDNNTLFFNVWVAY